ncbi:unnamed protein product [Paramecium octaurelia]|uniref:Transmembrane protein n=1 Tax=Paramecium octaurelia TaxID=43137 RepID=A0A8S1U060_PAROT|nr:unnamed protein product [Paramecium octaurelia]
MSINKNLEDDKAIEIDENILSNSDGTLNVIEEYHQQNETIEEVAYNYIHFAIYLFYYSIIQVFLKQQSTIMVILIIHALLSTISLIINIINSKNIINKLKIVLRLDIEISLFWFVTILNVASNLAIYYFSYQAYNLKQYRLYERLSKLIFFSFFIQQFQQFDFQINVMLIFIKILTQFYVKNTAHLIKSILSLPQFNSI